jgi:hypothetical protein
LVPAYLDPKNKQTKNHTLNSPKLNHVCAKLKQNNTT